MIFPVLIKIKLSFTYNNFNIIYAYLVERLCCLLGTLKSLNNGLGLSFSLGNRCVLRAEG